MKMTSDVKMRYGLDMRKTVAVLALVATAAWAGEDLLGRLYTTDGGPVNNATTGYGSAGCGGGGPNGAPACRQAFRVPNMGAPISIQCSTAAVVKVNYAAVDAGDGVRLAADQFFTTSVKQQDATAALPDGGSYSGGLVSIAPVAGATAAECAVFVRTGKE